MKTSSQWLNTYFDRPADVDEQADVLTQAGFPAEAVVPLDDGDTLIDFETTSNRGDCLCHVGLARELAATTGRVLNVPSAPPTPDGADAGAIATVTNEDHGGCPLYTARIVKGVRVAPSPDWLQQRLRAIGLIPRNNLVDATNFVLFELGQPTHVFDLDMLTGPAIVVRRARNGEPFLPIGEGAQPVKLSEDDLVIADAKRAVAIAGVKGGAETAVTENTTNILIEAATFDHAMVRNTSRRLGISSDSCYRFERGVHPATVDAAADRLVQLILELCGGECVPGVVRAGAALPTSRKVTLRPDRCRRIIGMPIDDAQMVDWLDRLGFAPSLKSGDTIACTVPAHRLDIEREIDLIEEVSRMFGHDRIDIAESINIRVAPPQPDQLARRAVNNMLVGLGYVEAVTHSLVSDTAARMFLPSDLELLRVDDERAGAEPALRPSVLPSLLRVLATNHDRGVRDVKLFEAADTFARAAAGHIETTNLALVAPVSGADRAQDALRDMRGLLERLVHLLLGPGASLRVEPQTGDQVLPWLEPHATVMLDNAVLGNYGMLTRDVTNHFGLTEPVCVAEVGVPALYDRYPPVTQAEALPAFPAIERDVSAIVEETTMWRDVERVLSGLSLQHHDAIEFVSAYRGKQIGAGRKSLTLRLRFRAADRTLTHDEVDPQMQQVMDALSAKLRAEIRS